MMIGRIAFLLFLICSLGCAEPFSERIIESSIPLENNSNREWRSGWLSAPENRSNPTSYAIEIPFILTKADSSIRVSDIPVLIMSGGPGNASLHMANGTIYSPWGKTRDLLVMDQRGTTRCKPSLACPEIDSMRIKGMKDGFGQNSLDSLKLVAVEKCYNRLTASGVDLNGYHTLESVEDIEALRKLLEIDQLILYGMSYSCNLMAAYAQKYPQHTKALILDSPLPHQANYDEDAFYSTDNILKNLIQYYTDSEELYEGWTQYIISIQDSLFSVSIDGIIYPYDKNHVIDLVLDKMGSHGTLNEVVPTIQKVITGNHEGIEDIIGYGLGKTSQAKGMRYSVWVSEELPEQKKTSQESQEAKYPWLKDYPVNDITFEMAAIWKVNSLYDNHEWPETPYDGPTLILSGQFDPWTPPRYGRLMKYYTPNAEQIIYPEHTHLPGFSEPGMTDISDFLNTLSEGQSF
ncbi:MAG: alpha/beta fold hydrolase [Saprospiraceae bacterium]|nr:alpha/beta fold hydrolase [Saprospiraceae bacterium]